MASITLRTDDMTGETLPDETPSTRIYVEDPRGNVSVEIDLSDTSFKALLKALDKYTQKARPITLPKKAKPATDSTEASEARKWALANPDLLPEGVIAKERGMVPGRIYAAWRAHLENASTES